jgi:hypothetical protein
MHSIASTRTLLCLSKILMIGENTLVFLHLTLLMFLSIINVVNNFLLSVVVHVVNGFVGVVDNEMSLKFIKFC